MRSTSSSRTHVAQVGDARDVDERGRADEPEVHHRHEALAAGQDLGVLAQLGQALERLLGAVDAVVVEGRGLHGCSPGCSRPARRQQRRPRGRADRRLAGDRRGEDGRLVAGDDLHAERQAGAVEPPKTLTAASPAR